MDIQFREKINADVRFFKIATCKYPNLAFNLLNRNKIRGMHGAMCDLTIISGRSRKRELYSRMGLNQPSENSGFTRNSFAQSSNGRFELSVSAFLSLSCRTVPLVTKLTRTLFCTSKTALNGKEKPSSTPFGCHRKLFGVFSNVSQDDERENTFMRCTVALLVFRKRNSVAGNVLQMEN